MPIYLTVNQNQRGAEEVRRMITHFVEQINQNHYKLDARQENNLQNLVNKYNEGVITSVGLDKSLGYAMDDIKKANNGK